MPSGTFVSVVAVVRDGAGYIEEFITELSGVLQDNYLDYEIILVDDGSDDESVAIIQERLEAHPGVRLLCLSRPFGEDVALTAGLESAIGDVVVTMSPNSDPPGLIPQLVERARPASRLLVGVQEGKPRPGWPTVFASAVFHRSAGRLLGVRLTRNTSQFRVIGRRTLTSLMRLRDRHRLLRLLTLDAGHEPDLFPYRPINRSGRPAQRSFLDSVSLAVDISVALGRRPLRIVSVFCLLASLLNLAYAGYAIVIFVLQGSRVAEGWTTLSLEISIMFFLLFVLLGVLCEYIGHILIEVKDRPLYHVSEEFTSAVVIPRDSRMNVVDGVTPANQPIVR